MKRVEKAMGRLEKAVELDPPDPLPRCRIARAYREVGKTSTQCEQPKEYQQLQADRKQLDRRLLLGTSSGRPESSGRHSADAP